MYRLAEKLNVGINLYGNTPSPTRDSFTWHIQGSLLNVVRFMRILKTLLG